jgi:hypothetical protein
VHERVQLPLRQRPQDVGEAMGIGNRLRGHSGTKRRD